MKLNKKGNIKDEDIRNMVIIIYLALVLALLLAFYASNNYRSNYQDICQDLGYDYYTSSNYINDSNIMIECDNKVLKDITVFAETTKNKWGEDEFKRYWYKNNSEKVCR